MEAVHRVGGAQQCLRQLIRQTSVAVTVGVCGNTWRRYLVSACMNEGQTTLLKYLIFGLTC